MCYVFVVFKQKTAYEMRISDWSSYVCSSDLLMPNDEQVIVLYRAQTGVKREDAKDILGLGVFTETLAETPHSLTYCSQIWREAVDKDPAVPLVAPAPVDPQALAQMQAAREAAEKKAGEFKASLQTNITQELQRTEEQATAHIRHAGIDVDA